jgi:hypothetical protein
VTLYYIYSNREKSLSIRKKADSFSQLIEEYGVSCKVLDVSTYKFALFLKFIFSIKPEDSFYVRDNFNFFTMAIALLFASRVTIECNRPLYYFGGKKSKIFQTVRNFFNFFMYSRVKKFNCVTEEILEICKRQAGSNRSYFCLGNLSGYLSSGNIQPTPVSDKKFQFAFVGDIMQPWQGSELIFNILRQNKALNLLVVGKKFEVPLDLQGQIEMVGEVSDSTDVARLVSKCIIGFSAMNMSIRGQKNISALKHADYVRAGIPIIASAADTFLMGKYPYALIEENFDFVFPEHSESEISDFQILVRSSAQRKFKEFMSWLKQ